MRIAPADFPAPRLARLAAATFPLACPPGSTRADQDAFIDAHLSPACFEAYLRDPARMILIATVPTVGSGATGTAASADGDLVGYTMLVTGEPVDAEVRAALTLRPTVELSKCYVLPGHHGLGVAPMLMAASIDAAGRTAAAGMWLGVNQLNARAQAFYDRSGFTRVGVKHFQVGDRLEDDYVLERAL